MRSIRVSFVVLALTLASRASPAAESSGKGETCDLSSPHIGCRLNVESLSALHAARSLDERQLRFDWGDLNNILHIMGTGTDLWDHKELEVTQASAQSQSVPSQTQVSLSQPSAQPQRRGPESKTCNISALTPGCKLDLNTLSQFHSTRNLDKRFHIPDLGNLGDIIDIGKTGIHWFDDYVGKDKGEDAA
ncbi:hypothetical protein CPB85DRAFT_1566986 [Mucidula mucida]|nr:hypothetical protein CPB85DRAFT_1566986 [Mucidula mucida]